MRDSNQHLDWLLVKWYDLTPRHQSTDQMRRQWRHKQEMGNLQKASYPDSWPFTTPKTDELFVTAEGRTIVDPIRGPEENERIRKLRDPERTALTSMQ